MEHMRPTLVAFCLLAAGPVAGGDGAPAPSATGADPRIPIQLAELRRENWRCLMRGHLASLIETMRRLSAGDFEGAAETTEVHYGLLPGTSEYCRESIFTKEASLAVARLPPAPPAAIPAMFKAMHEAGGVFVTEARKAKTTGDAAPAWQALAGMAEYCNACHAAYRLQ